MKSLQYLCGISLLILAFSANSQDSLCNPCVDGPDVHGPNTFRTLTLDREDAAPPSASWTFSRIREMGGELGDIVHDCGAATTRVLEQISFSVRACNWGGRYPALLFAPAISDHEGSLVVLASNGSSLEVLFSEPPSRSVFGVFDGLLPADFDEMFLEFGTHAED